MLYLVICSLLGSVSGRTILDLTHTLDENAPKWPLEFLGIFNRTCYRLETLIASDEVGTWLDMKRMEMCEHQGTHIDAPSHFGKGRPAMHEIPPERLMGPGVVLDVREKARANQNYGLSLEDIREYEETYGRIPPNAIVMMNSGWAANYHDPKLAFGTGDIKDSSTFNFPGFTFEACKMLFQDRQVSVVGTDAPSPDIGNANEYPCHLYLQPNDVPILENVANLDSTPPSGTTVFIGAMKHRGGSGGPVRIFAIIDDGDDDGNRSGAAPVSAQVLLILEMVLLIGRL